MLRQLPHMHRGTSRQSSPCRRQHIAVHVWRLWHAHTTFVGNTRTCVSAPACTWGMMMGGDARLPHRGMPRTGGVGRIIALARSCARTPSA